MKKYTSWNPGSMHPIFGIPFVIICIALVGVVFFGGIGLIFSMAQ